MYIFYSEGGNRDYGWHLSILRILLSILKIEDVPQPKAEIEVLYKKDK